VTELKNRGVLDIFIACVGGLNGCPEAIQAVLPEDRREAVHMVRSNLNYVNWKFCKEVAADLRAIYAAVTIKENKLRLDEFDTKWGADYPPVVKIWRGNWSPEIK